MKALQMTVPMKFGNVKFVGVQSLGSCLGLEKVQAAKRQRDFLKPILIL